MDKCVFCGWSRRCAYPAIRFYGIPKEPGMKRVQWLHAIGRREITNKDRVCSVHFRSGRPSSDPSHEDFVPHLFLNREAPPEVLQYLEALVESKSDSYWEPDYKASLSMMNNSTLELHRVCRPSILKRKRKVTPAADTNGNTAPSLSPNVVTNIKQDLLQGTAVASTSVGQVESKSAVKPAAEVAGSNAAVMNTAPSGHMKRVKLQILQRPIAEAAGVKPGQTVIIKRRIPVLRTPLPVHAREEVHGSIPGDNIVVAEEQTIH